MSAWEERLLALMAAANDPALVDLVLCAMVARMQETGRGW